MDDKMNHKTYHRSKTVTVFFLCTLMLLGLAGRLVYLMVFQSEYYTLKARELHERERSIKAARGRIIDANGKILADNKTVCTVSVIHSQITDAEEVIAVLSEELGLSQDYVRKRVEKYSSIEKIKSNVDKAVGDAIRSYALDGVKVDEDYKRYYPYDTLASKALGFTGGDNQGIIGLEVIYEEYLKGEAGTILTVTDAKGVEQDEEGEERVEPVSGRDLYVSLDINIQSYATQLAKQTMETKEADHVSILVMNPQNGEILAMVDVPEFDLNNPYTLPNGMDASAFSEKKRQELLNAMWRNGCINDTYEPGSTFKIITATSALEANVVKLTDTFSCPGFKVVEDRRIRCHKTTGHGAETFVQGVQNSCNPVFMEVGARLGVDGMYTYLNKLGILNKTGVDVPGEAATIMHQKKNVGAVELATMSFGQSFQLTPLRLLTTVSAVINGGRMVTPHFGVRIESADKTEVKKLTYEEKENVVSKETSDNMRMILESVVSEGSGGKAAVSGYKVGAKTGTSEKLPRSSNRYIASTLGFAPVENPVVLAVVLIDEPEGIYYGGQIAAPVISELLDDALPYLGIERKEEEATEKPDGE